MTSVAASRSLVHDGEFVKLWAGQTISQLGSQVSGLALPLAAVYLLHASAFKMGVLGALFTVPFLFLSLPVGVWVDRLPRRPVLIAADVVRAAALLLIPLAWSMGVLSMSVIYAGTAISGSATVFFDVAYQSYLPSLVRSDQLVDGNSKLELSRSAASISGPAFAGPLIQVVGAPVAVLVDAASYVVSAVSVWLIRRPEQLQVHAPGATMRSELLEGLRFVLGHRYLRAIAGNTATWNLFSSMAWSTFILFATEDLGLDAVALGAIFAVGNIGFIAGAASAAMVAERFGLGRTLAGVTFVGALLSILVPLATPATALVLLSVAGVERSFSTVIYNINQVSLRQALAPARLQGRMNASMRFLVWGTMPVGAIAGGALATAIGLREAILIASVLSCTASLWLVLSPVIHVRHPEEVATPD